MTLNLPSPTLDHASGTPARVASKRRLRTGRSNSPVCRTRCSWVASLLVLASLTATSAATSEELQEVPPTSLYHQSLRQLTGKYYRQPVYATLSDVWLCLACAVGWTVWLISCTARNRERDPGVFDSSESYKVMGHVLQVSVGEDADGTGIPVYHALIDYVVEQEDTEQPLQIRKQFSTRRLLQEGFANVEVLVLQADPTTSILFEDYLLDKEDWEREIRKPPNMIYRAFVYVTAALLIGTSLFGGLHAIWRLDPDEMVAGYICLGVGTAFIYPTALLTYRGIVACIKCVGPLKRQAVVIHGGEGWDCTRMCGATLNPIDMMRGDSMIDETPSFQSHPKPSRTLSVSADDQSVVELSQLHAHSMDTQQILNTTPAPPIPPRSPMFPNAGCGFGEYNVHMPHERNTSMQESTVSSISSKSYKTTSSSTLHVASLCSFTGATAMPLEAAGVENMLVGSAGGGMTPAVLASSAVSGSDQPVSDALCNFATGAADASTMLNPCENVDEEATSGEKQQGKADLDNSLMSVFGDEGARSTES